MNNKKMIVISTLFSFRNKLWDTRQENQRSSFITNISKFSHLSSLESTLSQLKFLGIVGWQFIFL